MEEEKNKNENQNQSSSNEVYLLQVIWIIELTNSFLNSLKLIKEHSTKDRESKWK